MLQQNGEIRDIILKSPKISDLLTKVVRNNINAFFEICRPTHN